MTLACTHIATQLDAAIQELFGMNIFRLLKEPLKIMISDLRSQQVRDTCSLLTALSDVLGDHMRHLLRDIFPNILDGVKVSNKVMSGYVDDCIITLIRNATFKTAIPILISEYQNSKAKLYRERCLDYVNEILVSWDIGDRDADVLIEAIRQGLEDAAVRGREISRLAYLNMFQLYPKKTERLKLGLDNKSLVARLGKEEMEFNAAELIRIEAEAAEEEARDCMPAIGAFSRQSILSVVAGDRGGATADGSNNNNYRESIAWTRAEARASLAGPVGRLSIGGLGGDRASNFFSAGFGIGSSGSGSGSGSGASDPFRELSNPNHNSNSSRNSSTSSSGGHSNTGEAKRFSIRDSFMASHTDVEILGSHSSASHTHAHGATNYNTDGGDSSHRLSSPSAGYSSDHAQGYLGKANGNPHSHPHLPQGHDQKAHANADSPQPLAFRTRRESVQDTGAKCIQAVVRGALARRKSLLFDEHFPQVQKYSASTTDSGGGSGSRDKENFQPALTPSHKNRPQTHSTGATGTKKTPSGSGPTANAAITAAATSGRVAQASTRKPANVAFQSPSTADLKARLASSGTGAQSRKNDRDKDTAASSQSNGVQPKVSRKSYAPQPSTVKKRAGVVAAMASTELTDTCKENVAALLKLKVAKTLEFVRKEMNLIRRLELDVAVSKGKGILPGSSTAGTSNSDEIYADIGDGMGELLDPNLHMPLPPPHTAQSKKLADEAIITDLMALSAQHIQLCRNMEDRFNTAILNTNDFSNM